MKKIRYSKSWLVTWLRLLPTTYSFRVVPTFLDLSGISAPGATSVTELVNIGQDFGDVLRFALGLRVAPWALCQKGQEPFRTEQLRMAHDETSRAFKHEKRDLLKRLQAGCDNSPKGTIDAPILPLVELLNNEDHFVTTSTCSGRISIFARPVIPDYSDELKEETTKTEFGR